MLMNEFTGLKPEANEKYMSRCLACLKRIGAPLGGWQCLEVTDICEDDENAPLFTCELCGCDKVRYVHTMVHDDFYIPLKVGCLCAGVMEGNVLAARARDRAIRNWSKRRKNFMKHVWLHEKPSYYHRQYHYQELKIFEKKSDNGAEYLIQVDGKQTTTYKEKPVKDLMSAKYAAFELADPRAEIMKPRREKNHA